MGDVDGLEDALAGEADALGGVRWRCCRFVCGGVCFCVGLREA